MSRTYDILGNTLTKGSTTFTWDALNRMTGFNGTATYAYRADGMRVSKASSGTTTRYRYDGQMGMQDVETTGANTVVTNYGLGAKGVTFPSGWEPQPSPACRFTMPTGTTWRR